MFLIVLFLNLPAALRLFNGKAHGVGDGICIHDYTALGISGRTPDGLNQRNLRTQEAFLVRIQNGSLYPPPPESMKRITSYSAQSRLSAPQDFWTPRSRYVQNGHQRDFRDVQALTEQVDSYQYVEDILQKSVRDLISISKEIAQKDLQFEKDPEWSEGILRGYPARAYNRSSPRPSVLSVW